MMLISIAAENARVLVRIAGQTRIRVGATSRSASGQQIGQIDRLLVLGQSRQARCQSSELRLQAAASFVQRLCGRAEVEMQALRLATWYIPWRVTYLRWYRLQLHDLRGMLATGRMQCA